jgi:hypothetical protein
MTVTFPINLLGSVGFQPQGYSFSLLRRQEYSRTAGGITLAKDFGTPLWTLAASTSPLTADDALDFEALAETLDGGLGTFRAWDIRRTYPRHYLGGNFADEAVVSAIRPDGKSISVAGLDAGFVLARGDYLSFPVYGFMSLFQVVETKVANTDGQISSLELRPHIPAGAQANTDIVLKEPYTLMAMVPGSLSKSQHDALHSVISFKAYEARF